MIYQLLATKRHMMQAWDTTGKRLPITVLFSNLCTVVGKANSEDHVLVGSGVKKLKNMNKPQRSQLEKAGIALGFRVLKEIRVDTADAESLIAGTKIIPSMAFVVGDMVKVTGTTKGKGFTGVVKRHGFSGGPRTHGQSDRERAPGSIGAGTTPGRVYKNKRMAGRSGNDQKTIEGLQIVKLDDQTGEIWVKGLVPGHMNSTVLITKVSEGKFPGLIEKKGEVVEAVTEVIEKVEEQPQEVVQA